MIKIGQKTNLTVPFALVLAGLLICAPAFGAPPQNLGEFPGYMDGSAFAELAGEDAKIVEVSVKGTLLNSLSRGFAQMEPELSAFLGGLHSISAVVVEGVKDVGMARKLIAEQQIKLENRGWERIAQVRGGKESVGVYIHAGEEHLDGLVVMVVDPKGEVVFANIAGKIDLARIAQMADKMGLPGLDKVGGHAGASHTIHIAPPAPAKKGDQDLEVTVR